MPGWVKPVFWITVILVVCYMMNINIPAFLGAVVHAIQAMHNSNAGNTNP
jgi:hypothetical protein